MDRIRTFIDQYKAQYSGGDGWTFEDSCMLKGLADLYRAAGDPSDRRWVLDFLARRVQADGAVTGLDARDPAAVSCGKAFFFALDETGDQRWRKAADDLHAHLSALPDEPEDLYPVEPFRTEYDSRWLSGLEAAGIAKRFARAGQQPGGTEGWCLLALADCIEAMPEQLYEHRRVLMDLFLAGARKLLAPGNGTDTASRAMKAYALLKGVRLGLLDPERYLAPGLAAFRELEEHLPGMEADAQTVGLFMMALSERLRS